MIDFAFLEDHFVLVVLLACLTVGYFLKHATFFKWISNNDIPVVLAIIGAVINSYIGGISVDNIVYGAIMGLASTGFHQAFKNWVENINPNGGRQE